MIRKKNDIYVTRPYLPPFEDFQYELKEIWKSGVVSNGGINHEKFEKELSLVTDVPYVSLFSNCTIALMVALKALDLKGDVITSPFSFPASVSSLIWNNLKPVFCDIDIDTFNINPSLIEGLITDKTEAILAVHAYGYPCSMDEIASIADNYNLKLIYDGAAAFGSIYKNKSVFSCKDISVVSFHATKIMNTFEGGAVFCQSLELKKKIDSIRNFGISNDSVNYIGLNGKMSEFNCLLGMHQLKYFNKVCQIRKKIRNCYNNHLSKVQSIKIPRMLYDDNYNNTYYPILINSNKLSRDEVINILKEEHIYARKYYDPLLSDVDIFKSNDSIINVKDGLEISEKVVCLPIYPSMTDEDQFRIINKLIEILS